MKWRIPKMWEGGEVWIIGGGPSMPRQFGVPEDVIQQVRNKKIPLSAYSPFLSPIHGKHVIGINVAFMLGNWVDMLFFGDGSFYWNNKMTICDYPNLKVTCNPNVNRRPGVYNVKFVPRDGNHPYGLTTTKDMVSWNKHSGGAAMSLARHLGVKRIVLLGFDMTNDNGGSQHWHGHYPSSVKPRPHQALPFKRHLESFGPIARDAKVFNIEILNVNKNSAIEHFRKVDLKDVL